MKQLLPLTLLFGLNFSFSQVAIISCPDQNQCPGAVFTLSSSNSIAGDSPIVSSIWEISRPSGVDFVDTTYIGTDLQVSLNTPALYDVKLTNVHLDASTSQRIETYYLFVFTPPIADYTYISIGAGIDNYPCPPVAIEFFNNSESSVPLVNFFWDFGATPIQASSSLEDPERVMYLYPGSYDLLFVVEDSLGCVDSLFVNNYLQIEGPTATPVISPVGGICNQEFSFELTNQSNVNHWFWELDEGEIINSTSTPSDSFNYVFPSDRIFYPTLFLVDNIGCMVPYRDTLVIPANGIDALFEVTPSEGVVSGTSVSITDQSSSSGNMLYRIWDFGDGVIDTTYSNLPVEHTYFSNVPVDLNLVVQDDRGCFDSYFVPINDSVNFSNNALFFYPNPTSGLLNFTPFIHAYTELRITDVHGAEVFSTHLEKLDTQIDVSPLRNGLYFFHLSTDSQEVILLFEKF